MKEKLASLAKPRYLVPLLMMAFSLLLLAYAVTQIQIHNTVTITTGASIQIIYDINPIASCPTTPASYSTSGGLPINQPAGGHNDTYLCIYNGGSGSDTPSVTLASGPATCGTGTSQCFALSNNPNPASITIAPQGFSPVIIVTISNIYLAPPNPAQQSITITVT